MRVVQKVLRPYPDFRFVAPLSYLYVPQPA